MIDVNAKELLQKAAIIGITPKDPNVNRTILGYLDLEKKEVVCFDKIQLATILMLARIGNDYINGPRRRIELYDTPGQAIENWKLDRANGMCERCPSRVYKCCANTDKCFEAWCNIRVDPYTEAERRSKEFAKAEQNRMIIEWHEKYEGLDYEHRDEYLKDDFELNLLYFGVREEAALSIIFYKNYPWPRDRKLVKNWRSYDRPKMFSELEYVAFHQHPDKHGLQHYPTVGKTVEANILKVINNVKRWREDAKKGETT